MDKELKKNQEIAEAISKKTCGDVFYMDSPVKMKGISWIDSGSPKMNIMLSGNVLNGYPMGRIIELIGYESSGKTTMAMQSIIKRQQTHPNEMFGIIDAEHALDVQYHKKLGLKDKNLFVCQPDYGEQGLSVVEEMIDHGFSIIVVDSVSALTTKAELEGDIGDKSMALQARMMSQALRMLAGKVNTKNTVLIFINQWREQIKTGPGYGGSSKVPTGGNALKFYASQRIDLTRSSILKIGDGPPYGNKVKARLFKSKVSNPFTETEFNIIYGYGIDSVAEYVDIAVDMGVIKQSGSWYSYGETKLGQGLANVLSLIRDNVELLDEIKSKLC